MAKIKAFKGWRPIKEKVHLVASRPYDVLNTEEARKEVEGKPDSFLHVVKPEIDFSADQNPYAPEVYLKGKDNFTTLTEKGAFFQDDKEKCAIRIIYRQVQPHAPNSPVLFLVYSLV